MATNVLYATPFISITYDVEHSWLYAQWQGELNQERVEQGCRQLTELLQAEGCTKILNDNTLITKPWSEGMMWGRRVWLPEIAAAGLRHIAWVYSPHIYSRLIFDLAQPHETNMPVVAAFDEVAAAYEWLARQ
jgi:hypothetical protein